MKISYYRHYIFSFLFFFLTGHIHAQQNSLIRDNFLADFVFTGNNIQFNFSTLSVLKARIRPETGTHPAHSKAALGFLFGFKYHINFNNYYSFITGPEAIIAGRNFITSFKKNDFSPPLLKDFEVNGTNSYSSDLIIAVPVLVEKRWLYSQTKFFFADAGICLNLSTGADFDNFFIQLKNINNGFYNVGGVDTYANNDAKPWISFPANVGHSWLLKNNNLLQLAICINISYTKYVNGTYRIDIPQKPLTRGKYSSNGSFVGLSINYVFTNANYRIRKAYQKKEF